jgi:hypothetical protein
VDALAQKRLRPFVLLFIQDTHVYTLVWPFVERAWISFQGEKRHGPCSSFYDYLMDSSSNCDVWRILSAGSDGEKESLPYLLS